MQYLDQDAAVAAVEELIKQAVPEAKSVSIVLWWDGNHDERPACIGVRVAEVTVQLPDGVGFWYPDLSGDPDLSSDLDLSGDLDLFVVCAAAERAIIARMVCAGFDDEDQAKLRETADDALLIAMGVKRA